MITRRKFMDTLATGAAGLAVASSAKSYAQILGANDRLNFAVMGLNGRGYAHLSALKANKAKARLAYVCDVETNILAKYVAAATREMGEAPRAEQDFRNALAVRDIDAITVATPDHWHTPMAILALKAGKHVYVEKPCSHNPAEGALLVETQRKHGKLVQMGSQQRSSPHTIEIVDKIHNGAIGRPYYAKAWYCNVRKSIGHGVVVPVPTTLDWDLFQGPAPREPYRNNVQPYNWHWFKTWGTGESLNNGTHEVDICRWALNVGYPNTAISTAGRYQFKDDWQFYDTMDTSFGYDDAILSWQGQCCNGMRTYGRDRGSVIMGTNGSVIVDRAGYEVYDLNGKMTSEYKVPAASESSRDLIGADSMTNAHFANFIAGIQTGAPLRQPVAQGNVAVTLMQLSNIAWEVSRELRINPSNGKILGDPEAMTYWGRKYQPGWEPTI
ncbi:MAG: Gfo/Idh/MocA family oxidoreductase [Acidobacteriaceae bacterium]